MPIELKFLSEQVLVVTGATSGNGLAIVERAVKHGAAVVAAARNEMALDEVKVRLAADGAHAAICIADVSALRPSIASPMCLSINSASTAVSTMSEPEPMERLRRCR